MKLQKSITNSKNRDVHIYVFINMLIIVYFKIQLYNSEIFVIGGVYRIQTSFLSEENAHWNSDVSAYCLFYEL